MDRLWTDNFEVLTGLAKAAPTRQKITMVTLILLKQFSN